MEKNIDSYSDHKNLNLQVALLTDECLPEGTRVHSKMFHELAVELDKRGLSPVVITPGNSNQKKALEISHFEGIEIWRFRSAKTRGVGKIRRTINEWALSYRAWIATKDILNNRSFDLCINYSPTIFFGSFAKRLKKRGAFVYLVLRDIFPQWAIDEGLITENSVVTKFFKYYEHLNYQISDCIALQSKANLKYFKETNSQYSNCKVLMNWAALKPKEINPNGFSIRKKLRLENKIIFFYGGNMGKAQDMDNLLRLAKKLKDDKNIHFLFVGEGDEFNLVKDKKNEWNLDNLTLKTSVSQNKFKEILCDVDIGLFSLSFKHSAHNFPGKLLGYMVQSIPILGSVNPGNDLQNLIKDSSSGIVQINGDDDLLAESALKLAYSESLRLEMGANARNLLNKMFSVESITDQILEEFYFSKN